MYVEFSLAFVAGDLTKGVLVMDGLAFLPRFPVLSRDTRMGLVCRCARSCEDFLELEVSALREEDYRMAALYADCAALESERAFLLVGLS